MAARKTKAAKEALEVIERAQTLSKQPRLGATVDKERLFASVYKWLKSEAENEPKYQSDNRPRDRWLSEAWMKEPHLAGLVPLASVLSGSTLARLRAYKDLQRNVE